MIENDKTQDPTLAEWLRYWHTTYKIPALSLSTIKREEYTIRLISSCTAASQRLSELTEATVQSILNELKCRKHNTNKVYSSSTLKKVKLALSQALQKAKTEKKIRLNPANELILPKAPTKKILPLTHAEEERLVFQCRYDPMGHICRFLLLTGLRVGELMNLRKSHYDIKDHRISINKSKTEAGIRVVYLVLEARKIIDEQILKYPDSDYIFHSLYGTPLHYDSVSNLMRRLRKSANIPNLTPHICRHTFVTRLCEKGVSAKAIAQIIGHAGTGYVLDIYAQLEKKELRRAIYALEENIGQEVKIFCRRTFVISLTAKLL